MEEQQYADHHYDSPAGCLLRLFWMMIGNAILLFCAFGVIQHRSSLLGIADAIYWTIVGSLLASRYVDIRYLRGTTTDGAPATMAHWRRYALLLGVAAVVLWLVMHGVAYASGTA